MADLRNSKTLRRLADRKEFLKEVSKLDKDLVGKVIHYYDKIGVAIIKLEKGIKTGDKVKFVHGDNAFEQTVESMQLEHAQVDSGKKDDEVAIKVDQVAKDGTLVYLS